MMSERVIRSGDAEICTEAFGDPGDPALLLIMGQMASMLWWPDELCRRLAESGRFVIRYDNRDTGRSTAYPPGAPPYGPGELVADAVAVLDGYGIERAHVAGMSMGGAIAQIVALRHPARVASLAAISTTRADTTDPDLPGPTPEYLEHAGSAEQLDWSDERAVAAFLVEDSRALSGTRHPFDEAGAREFVAHDLERTVRPESLVNHALMASGEDERIDLGELGVPLLVLHGSADPLIPHAHGEALAAAVPAATLVTIEGGGHELHERDWDQIVAALAAHSRPPAA